MAFFVYLIAALVILLIIAIVANPSSEESDDSSSSSTTDSNTQQSSGTNTSETQEVQSSPVQSSETGQSVQTIPASQSAQTPAQPTESAISSVLKTYFNIPYVNTAPTRTTRYILIEKAFMHPQLGSSIEIFEAEIYNGTNKIRPVSISAGSERPDGGNPIRRSIDGWTGTMGQTNWSKNLNDLWVKIDLGMEYEVTHIKLFTRKDCCRDRWIGVRVKFLNAANVETFKSRTFQYLDEVNKDELVVSISDPYEISKNNVVNGRFVILERTANSGFGNQLTVREIRAFDANNNIIIPKSIDAGSRNPDGRNPPSRAIDGVLGHAAQTNWSTNINDHWFKLDLGADREIKAVYVYNRTDCCRNRMLNTRLKIIDESGLDRYISATIVDNASVEVDIMKFEI